MQQDPQATEDKRVLTFDNFMRICRICFQDRNLYDAGKSKYGNVLIESIFQYLIGKTKLSKLLADKPPKTVLPTYICYKCIKSVLTAKFILEQYTYSQKVLNTVCCSVAEYGNKYIANIILPNPVELLDIRKVIREKCTLVQVNTRQNQTVSQGQNCVANDSNTLTLTVTTGVTKAYIDRSKDDTDDVEDTSLLRKRLTSDSNNCQSDNVDVIKIKEDENLLKVLENKVKRAIALGKLTSDATLNVLENNMKRTNALGKHTIDARLVSKVTNSATGFVGYVRNKRCNKQVKDYEVDVRDDEVNVKDDEVDVRDGEVNVRDDQTTEIIVIYGDVSDADDKIDENIVKDDQVNITDDKDTENNVKDDQNNVTDHMVSENIVKEHQVTDDKVHENNVNSSKVIVDKEIDKNWTLEHTFDELKDPDNVKFLQDVSHNEIDDRVDTAMDTEVMTDNLDNAKVISDHLNDNPIASDGKSNDEEDKIASEVNEDKVPCVKVICDHVKDSNATTEVVEIEDDVKEEMEVAQILGEHTKCSTVICDDVNDNQIDFKVRKTVKEEEIVSKSNVDKKCDEIDFVLQRVDVVCDHVRDYIVAPKVIADYVEKEKSVPKDIGDTLKSVKVTCDKLKDKQIAAEVGINTNEDKVVCKINLEKIPCDNDIRDDNITNKVIERDVEKEMGLSTILAVKGKGSNIICDDIEDIQIASAVYCKTKEDEVVSKINEDKSPYVEVVCDHVKDKNIARIIIKDDVEKEMGMPKIVADKVNRPKVNCGNVKNKKSTEDKDDNAEDEKALFQMLLGKVMRCKGTSICDHVHDNNVVNEVADIVQPIEIIDNNMEIDKVPPKDNIDKVKEVKVASKDIRVNKATFIDNLQNVIDAVARNFVNNDNVTSIVKDNEQPIKAVVNNISNTEVVTNNVEETEVLSNVIDDKVQKCINIAQKIIGDNVNNVQDINTIDSNVSERNAAPVFVYKPKNINNKLNCNNNNRAKVVYDNVKDTKVPNSKIICDHVKDNKVIISKVVCDNVKDNKVIISKVICDNVKDNKVPISKVISDNVKDKVAASKVIDDNVTDESKIVVVNVKSEDTVTNINIDHSYTRTHSLHWNKYVRCSEPLIEKTEHDGSDTDEECLAGTMGKRITRILLGNSVKKLKTYHNNRVRDNDVESTPTNTENDAFSTIKTENVELDNWKLSNDTNLIKLEPLDEIPSINEEIQIKDEPMDIEQGLLEAEVEIPSDCLQTVLPSTSNFKIRSDLYEKVPENPPQKIYTDELMKEELFSTLHCRICNKNFKSFYAFCFHMDLTHIDQICAYVCKICHTNFDKKMDFEMHMAIHGCNALLQICTMCNNYILRRGYKQHMKKIHNIDLPENPPVTDMTLLQTTILPNRVAKSLEIFGRAHNKFERNKPVDIPPLEQCPLCGTELFEETYWVHMKRHLKEERHVYSWNKGLRCKTCGYVCTHSSFFDAHQETHDILPTTKYCSACCAQFNNSYDYNMHLILHRGMDLPRIWSDTYLKTNISMKTSLRKVEIPMEASVKHVRTRTKRVRQIPYIQNAESTNAVSTNLASDMNGMFMCPTCVKVYLTAKALFLHMHTEH